MSSLNRVILMGNLTRDPEVRDVNEKTKVCNISLAINRVWKNTQGEKQEEATFVDAEAWGKSGQTLEQYLHKGDPLIIEGRLRQDRWEDKEGKKRSKLKVVIENFRFIGKKRGSGETEATDEQAPPAPVVPNRAPSQRPTARPALVRPPGRK